MALFRQYVAEDSARVTRHTQALAKLAKVASITIAKSGEEQPPTLSALAGTIEVMVPMAGVIDVDKELARLDKERSADRRARSACRQVEQ